MCIMILQHEKHQIGSGNRQIYGILFDSAWLWEEYIATLLPQFIHPKNKEKMGGISIFSDRTRIVYPDFYDENNGMILDAKYKRLESTGKGIAREDLYQIISYLHILNAKRTGLIYPATENSNSDNRRIGSLSGCGGEVFKFPVMIPQITCSYDDFVVQMKTNELEFVAEIKSYT